MLTWEKLDRLTRLMNRKRVSKAAGLGIATLANILSRESGVSVKTAKALAAVLGVDFAWLIDDRKGWPPVRVEEPEACHAA